jgi:hypothetical protein
MALAAVVALALKDTVRFDTEAELGDLTFGSPFGWLRQDQSALDPPFPGTTTLRSPWEHSLSIEVAPLALNVAIVMLVALGMWLSVLVVRSRWSRDGVSPSG